MDMNKEDFLKDGPISGLPDYMSVFINDLESAGKYAAAHIYTCTLRSFMKFSGGKGAEMPVSEAFTVGKLKAYQEWLLKRELSWNSISTYMRTLRAVANRIYPPGSAGYIPGLFNDVYTKVESRTKRALTEKQAQILLSVNMETLPENAGRTLAYFRLMFLFRGMPFIDLAHLRKRDIQGNLITYCRHKTGKQMTVCIPDEAVPLLKKFADSNPESIYLFPILNDVVSDGVQLYRCYLDALRGFNKRLGRLSSLLLQGVKLSSYTARHTWATLSFHLGTPVGIISEALGHSSVRVTETYLKPFERKRVDDANYKLIASVIGCSSKNEVRYNTL